MEAMPLPTLSHAVFSILDSISAEALSPSLSTKTTARATLSVWFISYTILIYDYFCTLESEINDVWTCQWSMGLLLFYLNRYLPALDLFLFMRPVLSGPLSVMECKFLFPLTFWLVTIGLITSQSIMVLRTYAIWGRRRLILYILTPITVILFSGILGITAWKTYLDVHNMRVVSTKGPDSITARQRCALAALTLDHERRAALLALYVMVFLGEAAIVTLTIIKANQHVSKFSPRWVSQLYKNGIIYCVCMLGLSIANASVIFGASYPYKPILLPAQRALHSMFANRVVLLIFRNRKRNRNDEDVGSHPNTTHSASAMDVFTSVYQEQFESGTDEDSWKTRAQLEWVQ